MVNNASPSSEYYSARSRTASIESGQTRRRSAGTTNATISLAPLSQSENGRRSQIGVSCSAKRQFKDRRIYVNARTGLPVRPPTSFGLFKHAMRRNMGNKVSFLDFNKRATEQWAKLREEEKEPYIRRARELSDQFKRVEVHFLRKKVRSLLEQAKASRRVGGGGGSGGRRTTTSSSSSAATTKRQIGNTARV